MPSVIWVISKMPSVDANGAASENHNLDIRIKNIRATISAETL